MFVSSAVTRLKLEIAGENGNGIPTSFSKPVGGDALCSERNDEGGCNAELHCRCDSARWRVVTVVWCVGVEVDGTGVVNREDGREKLVFTAEERFCLQLSQVAPVAFCNVLAACCLVLTRGDISVEALSG